MKKLFVNIKWFTDAFYWEVLMITRLKDLREDRDLVQKEVAAYLNIDQRVYSNYETGKREIPTRYVVALADFYKTSTDYILGRTNHSKPYSK